MSAIPKKALNQHIGVLGKTRSGKSSVIRAAFVEPLLEQGKPVCIIDPKGDWWGIKSSKSGKSAGYPVVIFGGPHADVPIDEHAGATVAELVATGNRPALIDLGGWMVGERTRFFNAFASTLFKLTRGQRWLVIDEVHNFAPQSGGFKNPDRNIMLHWANRLASEGLGRGITLIAASQRPQKVHKDFVTSMETLIAMRVIHPLDRNAIKDWMDGCGDPKLTANIIATLASFKRGEAWVWSPEIGFGPKRMQFEMFKTYDSFKAQPLDMQELKGWASVDLDQVKAKLVSVVEKAEANNPAKLRARIRELEKGLRETTGEAIVDDDETTAQIDALEHNIRVRNTELNKRRDFVKEMLALLVDAIDIPNIEKAIAMMRLSDWPDAEPPDVMRVATGKVCRPRNSTQAPVSRKKMDAPQASINDSAGRNGLSGPERRILDSLAWWERIGITKVEDVAVAAIANYSAKGSAYTKPRGSLRAFGLLELERGVLSLTAEGKKLADYPPQATGEELRERVLAVLPGGPERRILKPLLDVYPDGLHDPALADKAGYSPNGSAYTKPRGKLRSMGFIERPSQGFYRARDFLFP